MLALGFCTKVFDYERRLEASVLSRISGASRNSSRGASYRERARRGPAITGVTVIQPDGMDFPFLIAIMTLLNEILRHCLLPPLGTLDRCHPDLHKCVRRAALEMPGRVLGDLENVGRTLRAGGEKERE